MSAPREKRFPFRRALRWLISMALVGPVAAGIVHTVAGE